MPFTSSKNWKTVKLNQIAEPVKEQWKVGDGVFDYIGLEHINQNDLSLNGRGTSEKLESNKFYFKKGDILFGKLRPYFRKVVQVDFDGVCSTDIWVFRAKEGFDQKFLFYFLANQSFVDKTSGASAGTRMPRADWSYLKNTEWKVPELPEQHEIAAILGSLDDKIELLRKENKTLESIVQTLFKEWFVDFRFPGATGKMVDSELGMIPEGWRVGKLGDVMDIKGGGTPSTTNTVFWNGDIYWTSPKDLSDRKDIFLTDTEKKITQEGLKQISSGLLPKGTLLLSSRAPIGYLAISNVDLAINQGYIAVLPSSKFPIYFAYLWIKFYMQEIIGAANGSTFLEISKTSFKNIDCVIPEDRILELFLEVIVPQFDKIRNNVLEIQTLSKIRDRLMDKIFVD